MKTRPFIFSVLGSVLAVLLSFGWSPVWADQDDQSVEERIKALEKEVGRIKPLEEELNRLKAEQEQVKTEQGELKAEQVELKKEATAAASEMLTYGHRPRGGVYLEAPDRSWGLRFRGRFHYRLMTWPNKNKAEDSNGFSQFDFALRRVRPRINFFWDNRFYELDTELDFGADRSIQVQHGELHVHFERLNPFLPELAVGPRVSAFFNRHDTNWGSSTGGLFDRSMFQDGAGIGAGSQNNAAGLTWEDVPIGPGVLLFQVIYSNQGLTNIADQDRPDTDKRAVHVGFNIEPFSKSKNRLLEGIDFGVGYQLDRIHRGEDGRDFFRVRTTERQRLRLIEVSRDIRGDRHYITPGFGWKIGPYWLRTALAWNRGKQEIRRNVRGRMWRIAHELWVFSPKGIFTGSVNTAGSLMLFTGFERDDYRSGANGLRECGPGGADCERAHASNANVGFWYFIRPGLRVGVEHGYYRVNKIGRAADDLKGVANGQALTFNSVEFGVTFDF